MKKPVSVQTLDDLGRVRLSKHFFMRDFLYSEISQIEGIRNIPDYPITSLVPKSRSMSYLRSLMKRIGWAIN